MEARNKPIKLNNNKIIYDLVINKWNYFEFSQSSP